MKKQIKNLYFVLLFSIISFIGISNLNAVNASNTSVYSEVSYNLVNSSILQIYPVQIIGGKNIYYQNLEV